MTTPKAILIGLTFIAIAVASIPYSNNIVTPALASGITRVAICDINGNLCAVVENYRGNTGFNVFAHKHWSENL